MPAEGTAVRHPFTGLRTPDTLYTVTSLKELATARGVAFTATLRRAGKIIGTVDNDGRGGMTFFHPRYWPPHPQAVTDEDLDAYAEQCRTEAAEPMTTEDLLNALVDEYDWRRRLKRANGLAVLREMRHARGGNGKPLGDPHVTDYRKLTVRADAVDIARLAPKLAALTQPDSWWQLWRDDHWADVTTRPASVPANHYR